MSVPRLTIDVSWYDMREVYIQIHNQSTPGDENIYRSVNVDEGCMMLMVCHEDYTRGVSLPASSKVFLDYSGNTNIHIKTVGTIYFQLITGSLKPLS